MISNLTDFLCHFRRTFNPPKPYRGLSGTNWYVSRVWSDYMRGWLLKHFNSRFELPVGTRRLDAALRSSNGDLGQFQSGVWDFALEWEWDHNKVHSQFPYGDFRKLLEVDARCGIAVVHTRTDGSHGLKQKATETLKRIHESLAQRHDMRPVGLVEIRRILHNRLNVEFLCHFIYLDGKAGIEPKSLRFEA